MKKTRIEKGFSILDVENTTKIRSKYLEAIENENFEVIPGQVYVRGFIKSYAKFLQVDNHPEITAFLEQDISLPLEQKIERIPIESPKGFNKKILSVFLGTLMVFLLIWGIQNFDHSFLDTKPVSENSNQPIENNESILKQEKNSTQTSDDNKPQEIELFLEIIDATSKKDACWARIYTDGNLNYEGILYQGDTRLFKGRENITVTLGNAGVVKLKLGEKDLGIPGELNKVYKKNFTLEDL